MSTRWALPTCFAIWTTFWSLAAAGGPVLAPTNVTIPTPIVLNMAWSTSQSGTGIMQNFIEAPVQPLTTTAGLNQPMAAIQKINVTGPLVLVTTQGAGNLPPSPVAYLSCEDFTYGNSNTKAETIFSTVSTQSPEGVILYSTQADHCNYTAGTFGPALVFTVIGSDYASRLETALRSTSYTTGTVTVSANSTVPPPSPANSSTNDSSPGGTNNSGNVLGPSPTTAVAMIILYSITGVITGLFLIIIITGAVRAHRHPERYGPRQGALGRPRQSRAKGIARAMLETLPIVKFGEREDEKPATDVELAASNGEHRSETGGVVAAQETDGIERAAGEDPASEPPAAKTQEEATSSDGPAASKSENIEGAEGPAATAKTENRAEEGLGCSICTEDFVKGEDVRVLPCNHKYHPVCIDPWLLNVSGTCPLCRVDLRPDAAANTDGTASTTNEPSATTNSEGLAPPIGEATNDAERRRQRRGISMYLEHHLGITIHSRPEERIEALRRLRNENREEGDEPPGERRRSRLSGIFPFNRRRISRVDTPEPEPAADDSAVASGAIGVADDEDGDQEAQRARNGTFAE